MGNGRDSASAEWMNLFQESDQAAVIVEPSDGSILYINAAGRRLLDLEATSPDSAQSRALIPLGARVAKGASGEKPAHFHWRHPRDDGPEIAAMVQLVRVHADRDAHVLALIYSEEATNPGSARFQRVTEIADALWNAEDFNASLHALLRHSAANENWAYSEAWVPDRKKSGLHLASCEYTDHAFAELESDARSRRIARGEGIAGNIVETRTPVWMPDIRDVSSDALPRRDLALRLGLGSVYAVPLVYEEQLVCVLKFYFRAHARKDRDLLDALTGLAGVFAMVIERRRVEQSMRERDDMMESLFANLPCSIYRRVLHVDGSVSYPYVGGRLLPDLGIRSGFRFPDARTALSKVLPDDRDRFVREIYRSAQERTPLNIEHRVRADDGGIRWLRTYSTPSENDDGSVSWNSFTLDISVERQLREMTDEQSRRDAITQLPTRHAFEEQLLQMSAASLRHDEKLGVLLFNVDRFHWINDAYGMAAGDALLAAVAERLRDTLPRESLLGRLGNDEFTIAFSGLRDESELRRHLSVLHRLMSKPFDVFDNEIHLSYTGGLCVLPDDEESADELLRCASLAMNRGRRENKGKITRFDAHRDHESATVISMERELRYALRNRQLEVHYQPQATPAFDRLTGFEALVRWRHPQQGMIPPNRFIHVAEESGLIDELFSYVLDRVCAQHADWQQAGLEPPPISVNLSPVQMRTENRIAADIARILEMHRVAPTCVKLEITEGTLLQNFDAGTALLNRLGEMGVAVVLDDFGVGYSSLGYLAQLPLRSIKIDRSFVRGLEQNVNAAKVLRAVIVLAHTLDMEVTVEGVETELQLDAIRQWQ